MQSIFCSTKVRLSFSLLWISRHSITWSVRLWIWVYTESNLISTFLKSLCIPITLSNKEQSVIFTVTDIFRWLQTAIFTHAALCVSLYRTNRATAWMKSNQMPAFLSNGGDSWFGLCVGKKGEQVWRIFLIIRAKWQWLRQADTHIAGCNPLF